MSVTGRQRLVVDLDGLERVGRRVPVGGDHDRDRLAHVPHLVDGQRVVVGVHHVRRHRPGAGQHPERLTQVRAR